MKQPPHATSPAESESPRRERGSRFVYAAIIVASTAASTAALMNVSPLLSANDRSRWCTVWSLVERGTYRIDTIIQHPDWDTIDKVHHDGHFYSTKPALLPTMVAGVYWAVKQTTDWSLPADTPEVTRVILWFVNVLPMAIALVVLAMILERYGRRSTARYFVLIVAGFGTFLTTFLVTLNNHTVAAVSVVFALYPALRIVVDGRHAWWNYALCGFFAAFACCNELPAAAFGVVMFLVLARASLKRTAAAFVPAALVPLAAFFVTNSLATGGLKPFYMYYGTEKYVYVFEGVPSYWSEPHGLDRSIDSPLTYLMHCTIGHHGILSLSPVFLITLAGWIGVRRWSFDRLKTFLWMGMGLSALVLAFYLTRTSNYNYGGNTSGLRWMFWLIPLWLIGMIPVCDAFAGRRWFQSLACVALAVSVFSATVPLGNPWRPPWLFTLMEEWEWIDYRESPEPLDRRLWSIFPTLPDESTAGDDYWIEFEAAAGLGRRSGLRLADAGSTTRDGRRFRRIRIERTVGTEEISQTVLIDVAHFHAEEPSVQFVVFEEGVPREEKLEILSVIGGGLPALQAYRGGKRRYLQTPLRRDAFACQMASAVVRKRDERRKKTLIYRTDLWLCPDVPFGVLQIRMTVTERLSGDLVASRLYKVRAAGMYPARSTLKPNLTD